MHIDMHLIFGAGGHSKVVFEAIMSIEDAPSKYLFADDNPLLERSRQPGRRFISADTIRATEIADFHIAIGDNHQRSKIAKRTEFQELQPFSVFHSTSSTASNATISPGCFVAAGAIVGPETCIGQHSIVNHGAVVDHDCVIEDFVHISPNATLGGCVSVGQRTLIGAGAVVLPGRKIGGDCIIGAGAVVVNDIPDGQTVVGVPAKRTKAKR